MNRVVGRKLEVKAVEEILFVTFGVDDLEFRWIQETSCVQSGYRNKVADLLVAVRKVETSGR